MRATPAIACMYVCMCMYVCIYIFVRSNEISVCIYEQETYSLSINHYAPNIYAMLCMICIYVRMYVCMYIIMIYMRIHAYIIDILRVVPRVRWVGRRCVRAWCARWSRRRSTPCTLAETHNTVIYYFTTYNEHTYIHTYKIIYIHIHTYSTYSSSQLK